jgi:hypothetical protein
MMELWAHGLSLAQASRATLFLLGLSLTLQTLEYLVIDRRDRVLRFKVQIREMPVRPGFLRPWLLRCFAPPIYRTLLGLRLVLALSLMLGWHGLPISMALMILALLLLFRWRGAFNGGSDFMTLMGLSALLLADGLTPWLGPQQAWRAALWFLTLQLLTSYFMSGWVKLKHPGWRNGSTLPVFLDTGVYGPLTSTSAYRRRPLAVMISWAFILWEGLFGLVFLDVRLAWLACASGVVFHFMVFRYFGLNRFFWAWLATYPALIYTVTETGLSLKY